MSDPELWTKRGAIYGATGLIITIIATIVAVMIPEIRCFVHLGGPEECNVATSGAPQPSSSAISDDYAAYTDLYRKENYFDLVDDQEDSRSAVLQYKVDDGNIVTAWNVRGNQHHKKIYFHPPEYALVEYRVCTGEHGKTPPEHCGKWTADKGLG